MKLQNSFKFANFYVILHFQIPVCIWVCFGDNCITRCLPLQNTTQALLAPTLQLGYKLDPEGTYLSLQNKWKAAKLLDFKIVNLLAKWEIEVPNSFWLNSFFYCRIQFFMWSPCNQCWEDFHCFLQVIWEQSLLGHCSGLRPCALPPPSTLARIAAPCWSLVSWPAVPLPSAAASPRCLCPVPPSTSDCSLAAPSNRTEREVLTERYYPCAFCDKAQRSSNSCRQSLLNLFALTCPDDGWQRGTVARVCPRAAFSHVVAYTRQTSSLRGTANTLLDAAS